MITEVATLDINIEKTSAFEAAMENGMAIIAKGEGCVSVALHRCVDQAGRYQLHVEWQTLEHHTVTFRQSEGGQALRALLGAFLAGPPTVQHYSRIR